MTIKIGDKIPAVTLRTMTREGVKTMTTGELFKGKTVVLFSLPGAFTPTCSAKHLPGFIARADEIKGRKVDTIACLSVNDAYVMEAWGKSQNAGDKVLMLADGNADFSKAVGLTSDSEKFGMGLRGQRYALVAKDGVVTMLNVEAPGAFEVSTAEAVLKAL